MALTGGERQVDCWTQKALMLPKRLRFQSPTRVVSFQADVILTYQPKCLALNNQRALSNSPASQTIDTPVGGIPGAQVAHVLTVLSAGQELVLNRRCMLSLHVRYLEIPTEGARVCKRFETPLPRIFTRGGLGM